MDTGVWSPGKKALNGRNNMKYPNKKLVSGITHNGKMGSLGVHIGLKDRLVIKISKIFITERSGMSACLGLQRCALLHLPAFFPSDPFFGFFRKAHSPCVFFSKDF